MPGIIHFPTFLFTVILLTVYPGQDSIYIISRSIASGRKAGVYAALGVISGGFIHASFAAAGLSLFIASHQSMFLLLRTAGAGYLFYLGFTFLLSKKKSERIKGEQEDRFIQEPNSKIYRQGLLTNLLNVKVIIFFISFLPQFVQTGQNFEMLPFLILSSVFWLTGTVWCLSIAFFTSFLSEKFFISSVYGFILEKMTGVVFIGFGIQLVYEFVFK
ncbi:MAG: LysE family translocator [Spirochaetia bacterium]|nr:LysE family translocator [Spirochaetia bacterium]